MTDRAKEIFDGCNETHLGYSRVMTRNDVIRNPCRACADRAVQAAREEILAVIRRNVDEPMRTGLLADIEDSRRSP